MFISGHDQRAGAGAALPALPAAAVRPHARRGGELCQVFGALPNPNAAGGQVRTSARLGIID